MRKANVGKSNEVPVAACEPFDTGDLMTKRCAFLG